jgi:hypothetical protein
MDSIQEQIVKKIVAALALITTANGYDNTIASVQRINIGGVETSALPTLLVMEGECTPELGKSSAPSLQRRMELAVIAITTQDEAAQPTITGGEILNSLIADIEQCVAQHRTWDGMAMTTDPPMYFDAAFDAITPHLSKGLRFEVVYTHLRNNPYAQQE